MQALCCKLMMVIAGLVITVLLVEVGIAVDEAGGKIYWTDSGTHQIHSANLNGSEGETLVKWAYDPRGIAVDNERGKIYRTDSRTHQIYRAGLDGSKLEVLIGSLENNQSALAD